MDQINSILDILKEKAPVTEGLLSLQNQSNESTLTLGTVDTKVDFGLSSSDNSLNINIGTTEPLSNTMKIQSDKVNINVPLNVSDVNITNNASINTLNISNGTTLLSTLNISGTAYFENNIKTKLIQSLSNNYDASIEDQSLNIDARYITIGNRDSEIIIKGTTTYIAATEFVLRDKLLALNLNVTNNSPIDDGKLSGLIINSTISDGYIQTNYNADRFLIKAPNQNQYGYILSVDPNNNLYISGSSILNEDVSILSNLYISNNTIINNDLIVNNNSLFKNDISILSQLYISGNTNIYNNLDISGLTTFKNSIRLVNLTTSERDNLENPQAGHIIFNTTTQKLNIYF